MRRIIGVDPGISTTGYGVIESDGDAISVITWGAISPPSKKTIHVRLGVLYDGIKTLLIVTILLNLLSRKRSTEITPRRY